MTGRDGHEVLWLQDVAARDAGVSGGKGANLAAMAAVGLPVPPGFVVPTATYRGVAAEAGLASLIETVLPGLDVTDPEALAAASERLRRVVETAPVPEDARASITTAYDALGGGRVAVRSSATAEDLPEASFAGQQETVLDVEGFDAVVDAVRRCWSSPWTARAIAYRARNRIPHQRLAVAVVVQRMVPAQVAGVLVTADPVTGIRHHVVVEATAGLGEPLVGGQVAPWRWRVDSSTRTVLEVPVGGEPPLLDRARLMVLVDLGVRAAALFRSPQDVEWATSNGRCWLLQSRPITSLFPVPSPAPAPETGLRVYVPVLLVGQGIAAPLTPSGTAFFRALLAAYPYATDPLRRWHRRPATASTGRPGWAPIARGRLFVDVTPILRAPRVRTLLVRRSALRDPIESAVLREWLERNGDRLSDARVSVELLAHGLSFAAQYVARVPSALVAPERARRRALRRGVDALSDLRRRADELRTVEERIEFVDREMPLPVLMFVFDQVPPVLAGLAALAVAERLVARWLGRRYGVEPVRRWLPHDPTAAMGLDLWRLASRLAQRDEQPSAADPGVAEFRARYGHRAADREIDVGAPRFADDPTYVLGLLRTYIATIRAGRDEDDALRRFEEGVAQAQRTSAELVAATRRVKGPAHAAVLRLLLHRGRALAGLREQPKFDLVRAVALARRVLRQVGEALVADGVLADAEDIFFLDPADVRAALREGTAWRLRRRVADNRREFELARARPAVPRILASDGEAVYAPAAVPGGQTLVGTPVSPGVHEGVVRVVASPVNAGLQPGEVLVAATTDPGWTPLFLTAGALVMEIGGVVSHGALVAREYGLPAVTAVADATTLLETGQRVRVDGAAGTVTVLSEA